MPALASEMGSSVLIRRSREAVRGGEGRSTEGVSAPAPHTRNHQPAAWVPAVVATLVIYFAGSTRSRKRSAGGIPVERFSWSPVKFLGNAFEILRTVHGEVCSLRKVLAQ